MQVPGRQGLFKYLAAVSIAVGCGAMLPLPRLLSIRGELVEDVVEALGDKKEPGWRKEDQKRVLLLLANDPRGTVRARVARAATVLMPEWTDDAQRVLLQLARDESAGVRAAAEQGFEVLLERASPVARVEIVCRGSVSEHARERLAVAKALCSATPVMVADLVIEELSRDVDVGVRLAALQAAQHRFADNPKAYRAIAQQRMEEDPKRRVRHAAQRFLQQLA